MCYPVRYAPPYSILFVTIHYIGLVPSSFVLQIMSKGRESIIACHWSRIYSQELVGNQQCWRLDQRAARQLPVLQPANCPSYSPPTARLRCLYSTMTSTETAAMNTSEQTRTSRDICCCRWLRRSLHQSINIIAISGYQTACMTRVFSPSCLLFIYSQKCVLCHTNVRHNV